MRQHRLRSSSAAPTRPAPREPLPILRGLGPGLRAGLAGNDPAGVATYAVAGAVAG